MHFGLQRVRRASWPIWSIMLQRGCIRRHFGKTDPSMRPHGEWHQGFPRLGPKRRQEVLWRISARSLPRLWPESAPFRLHFGRPLGHNQGVQRVSTKTKECASALPVTFGDSSPSLGFVGFAFTSDEFGPKVVDLGWFMSSGCKKCSWRREPSRGSILGNILRVMRRSGGGRMESSVTPQ